jgi:hypothetical protein
MHGTRGSDSGLRESEYSCLQNVSVSTCPLLYICEADGSVVLSQALPKVSAFQDAKESLCIVITRIKELQGHPNFK